MHTLDAITMHFVPPAVLWILAANGKGLGRQHSARVAKAPTIQGSVGELRRLLTRAMGAGDKVSFVMFSGPFLKILQ